MLNQIRCWFRAHMFRRRQAPPVVGTIVDAEWLNAIQEDIKARLNAAGDADPLPDSGPHDEGRSPHG